MDKNIIILERRLFSAIGHERTQVSAINELIGNEKTLVISCEDIDSREMPFKNKIISQLPKLNLKEEGQEPKNYIQESGKKLIKIFHEHKLNKINKIIIPSARKLEISVITDLYEKNKFPPNITPVIRILDIVFIENLPKATLSKFFSLVNKGEIHLYAETKELTKKIKNDIKIKCLGELILPVSVPYNVEVSVKKVKNNHICVGCLGNPRPSKGTFLIPKIIKSLRQYFQKNQINLKVTFVIQLSKDKTKRTIFFKIYEYLSRYISSYVKVKYVYGIDDNKEFIKLMKSIDIFLLPYSNIKYKYNGSGFITDAIFLEKPIINSKGMSMKDLTSFKNSESASNIEDYSKAIIKIAKNYEYYVKNSRLAKEYLKKKITKSFNLI